MQTELLKNVIKLTAKMIELSKSGEWSSITEMQLKRASLMSKVLPLSPTDNEPSKYAPLLKIMIEQNQQLQQCCTEARQKLKNELNGMSKNKKAVAAYKAI